MQRSETNCPLGQGLLAAAVSFAAGLAVVAVLLALSRPQMPATAAENGREAVRRTEEAYLARRIVSVLEPFVGEGKVRAEVRLEIDYDTVSSGEEIFDPDGQVLRAYTAAANFASEAEYEISRYSRRVVKSGGRVKRLSALVLVDGLCPDGVCRDGEAVRLASMVAPVIGFEPRRGDILQIENVSFAGKGQIVPLLLAAAAAGLAVWGLNFFRGCRRRQKDGGKNTVWKTLENTDAEALAAYLSGESPSVAAYVLLRLNRPTAETVLNGLPLPFAAGVLAAMAVSAPVAPEIAAEIERTLSRDFAQSVPNGRERAFALFAAAGGERRRELLSVLETEDPVLAGRLRATMFNFEDFNAVSDDDIRRLFDEVEAERLAVALRGASERLKQRFFADMSPEAAAFIRKEMAALGPVKLKEVEAAQDEIIEQAARLAAAGKIRLRKMNGGRV